jgi:hypothetical protein
MFGKIASDALGLSDIGVIISPAEYSRVDADDYLFHEDGERIFFLIKSKKDEYCFTNLALIHVDGESAVSSKRSIKRYEYANQRVGEVLIETAGTMDRDVELKFRLGDAVFSIDVKKQFLEQVKDIYKALIAIGRQQVRDMGSRENAVRTLDAGRAEHGNPGAPPQEGFLRRVRALHSQRCTTAACHAGRLSFRAGAVGRGSSALLT